MRSSQNNPVRVDGLQVVTIVDHDHILLEIVHQKL